MDECGMISDMIKAPHAEQASDRHKKLQHGL
jgi:hypothetical protein